MTNILVVDDEEMIRFAFEQFLMDEGYEPLLAADADSAMEQIHLHHPSIVFMDYRLPGRDGLDLIQEIGAADSKISVVFMTAFGAMDVAIKAMQYGAYEYLTKPLDLDKIKILIRRILEAKKTAESLEVQSEPERTPSAMTQMVGKGPAMQEVFKMIGLLTMQDVTVLITGESGVGKELVAHAIHENSPRANHPFVAINCGAMPENLLEAEMFGYEKGAFTGADSQKPGKFEAASQGTIFLDEIGELQPQLQVKLLRVLQEQAFERVGGNKTVITDARIIAATNKDLIKEVENGRFRKDLYYRLHLIHVHLPPLRERKEDIPLLIEHFIQKANLETGRKVLGITQDARLRLETYSWPGNVRELENQIRRAMVLSREDVLSDHIFETETSQTPETDLNSEKRITALTKQYMGEALASPQSEGSIFEKVTAIVEKALIQEALERTGGNQMQAAQLLGMNRTTLRKKIKGYGIG